MAELVGLALDEIAAAVLTQTGVLDCVVRVRETEAGAQQLVAYVVPAGPFSRDALEAHLRPLLAPDAMPRAFVPLTGLPLDPRGEVDEEGLARIPVTDEHLAQRWEARIRAVPEIDQV